MIKKTVTFEDFNGNEVTEDLWFNLSKTELTKMQFSKEKEFSGGMEAYIRHLVDSDDRYGLVEFYRDIILAAYGKKSDDGRSFLKTPAIREAFEYSAAFDEFFFKMMTEEDQHVDEFIIGIMPKGLVDDNVMAQAKEKAAELIRQSQGV